VSLSPCLTLCLSHRVSHCVSFTVSPTVSLSLCLTPLTRPPTHTGALATDEESAALYWRMMQDGLAFVSWAQLFVFLLDYCRLYAEPEDQLGAAPPEMSEESVSFSNPFASCYGPLKPPFEFCDLPIEF
jgi:hypothetical protein